MTRGKSLSFAWPESFVQRYWIIMLIAANALLVSECCVPSAFS